MIEVASELRAEVESALPRLRQLRLGVGARMPGPALERAAGAVDRPQPAGGLRDGEEAAMAYLGNVSAPAPS
jgi:hypothetical protein